MRACRPHKESTMAAHVRMAAMLFCACRVVHFTLLGGCLLVRRC